MAGLAALQYSAQSFDTRVGKLMGRQMAGQTFLEAWIRHSGADPLTSFTHSDADRAAFVTHARELGWGGEIVGAARTDVGVLEATGALWLADPSLAPFAWNRRWHRQNAWSIVGITHTMSSHAAMDRVVALLTAPVQPWDALICTSQAIRRTVVRVLEEELRYLADRLGATRFPRPELPVIPLGVHCDSLAFTPEDRARWRAELGIAEGEIAVLQFGRLSLHAKAHPLPLYLALAQAARRTSTRLHLIFAGKFINEPSASHYRALAEHFAPTITTHFVDGGRADAGSVRAAADIGTLLSDNIQESFGLAPVELMAAGLPVVASDWDGLRDTVEHGITGFRIDTLMPPPGTGETIAYRHALDVSNNDAFVAAPAQSTAIDIAQAADAFAALAADADLRRGMGSAGRARALAVYDWRVVIAAYRDLLAELAARRTHAAEVAPVQPTAAAQASRMDPFAAFAGHATQMLTPDMRFVRAPDAPTRVADIAGGLPVSLMVSYVLPPADELEALFARVGDVAVTAADLLGSVPAGGRRRVIAAIGWLLKFGFLARI
jgi:alpha-maltose-1-phosphate synthase